MLAAVSRGLTMTEAAKFARMSRRSIYDWKTDDPAFARELEAAFEAGTDVFEQEARRRAFRESDALLIFLMKQRDPYRFNRKMLTIESNAAASPIVVAAVPESGRVTLMLPHSWRDKIPPGTPIEVLPEPDAEAEAEAEPEPPAEDAA